MYAMRHRALKLAATIEDFGYEEIFERDGWRCGICGERIDKTVVHPDRRSASLDHVVPLSKGGEHSRANVQAAHLGCNSTKGNRCPKPEQLRLVG
jgi:5-methylcytosine-specific restriction endonuclease McrA